MELSSWYLALCYTLQATHLYVWRITCISLDFDRCAKLCIRSCIGIIKALPKEVIIIFSLEVLSKSN